MILLKVSAMILLALVGFWITFGLAVAVRLLHGMLDAVGY
jgi:hypothetical protein